jgi:hypothetical protein
MSRTSYRDRIKRLKRQLRGDPDIVVRPAPWLLEDWLGRKPTPQESRWTIEEFFAHCQRQPRRETPR